MQSRANVARLTCKEPEMKSTVTVRRYREESEQVEVEFPIYRRHDVAPDDSPPDDYFERVESDGTVYSIHRTENGWGNADDETARNMIYEIRVGTEHFNNNDKEYVLGLGQHALSPTDFYKMLERARKFLERFPEK